MFAVLEFSDFFWIWVLVILAVALYSGGRAASAGFQPLDVARLRRLEAKADLILKHLGLECNEPATPGGLSEEVRALADNPARKIEAIKLHREQTGLGLKEAKDAVETYMAGCGLPPSPAAFGPLLELRLSIAAVLGLLALIVVGVTVVVAVLVAVRVL